MKVPRMTRSVLCIALFASLGCSIAVAQCPTPGVTTLTAPAGDTSNRRPIFQWRTVADAAWYYVWIERNGAVYHREWLFARTEWQSEEPMPAGDYRWWVQTWNPCGYGAWSSPMSFTLTCNPLDEPWIQTPNNVVLEDRGFPPTLVWDGTPYATWARVYIKRDGQAFFNQWLPAFGYGYGWTPDFDFPCGNYEWWVKEWESCGGETAWSQGAAFDIVCCSNLPVETRNLAVDYLPLYGFTPDPYDPRPDLNWDAVDNATWYKVEVKQQGSVFEEEWVTAPFWFPDADLPPGNYTFRVRTWNPCGQGPWSTGKTFTVACTNLPAPATTAFLYGYAYFGYGGNPGTITWDRLPGTYWYQLWVRRNGEDVYNRWLDAANDWGEVTLSSERVYAAPDLAGEGSIAGTYDWWVRGWNGCGLGPWSQQGTTIIACQPSVPVIRGPTGTVATIRPFFEWEAIPDVQAYELFINRNGNEYYQLTVEPQIIVPTAEPKGGAPPELWIPPWDFPDGDYEWWLRAIDNCSGEGRWSDPGTFTLAVPT